MHPTVTLRVLRAKVITVLSTRVITARPIEFVFFYMPWPVAAASSDFYMSSIDIAFELLYPTAFAGRMLWPVGRVYGITFSKASVIGFPSVSMVIPAIIP